MESTDWLFSLVPPADAGLARPLYPVINAHGTKVFFVAPCACGQLGEILVEAFILPLAWVFLAELGDKTQLVALCFATRFKTRTVMAGVFSATLVVHVLSVVLGKAADKLLPIEWISLIAGLAFIGFGLWTVRGDEADEDSCQNKQGVSPFWVVASTFFLAELGDKTMLMTVSQAAIYPKAMVLVWLGSSLGMVLSDGLAIIVGKLLGKNLPERAVKIGASVAFFGFGFYKIYQGLAKLSAIGWIVTVVVLGVLALVFLRGHKKTTEEYALPVPDEEPVKEEAGVK